MRRLGFLTLILLPASLGAASYKPPVEPMPKTRPQAWVVKKKGEGRWCAFPNLKAVQAALDSGDYDDEDRAAIWAEKGVLRILVSNDSEDAMTDDLYYLDAHQKITRMVRSGHYIRDPMFSVTFVPDWTGRLTMTPASREVVRRMEQAEYEPYVTDWAKFAGFDRMPFRNLIQLRPVVMVKKGCSPTAH